MYNIRDERELAKHLCRLFRSQPPSPLLNVFYGDELSRHGSTIEKTLATYFGAKKPLLSAVPDVILVFNDYGKLVDNYLITAVELKYFKQADAGKLYKNLRKAYRAIGQPLRYLLWGYDSAILMHVFNCEITDELIREYSELVNEVVKKLKLPMAYFSIKMLSDNEFRVFKPAEIPNADVQCIARWIFNMSTSENMRNPLIQENDKDVVIRRRSLKAVMKIP